MYAVLKNTHSFTFCVYYFMCLPTFIFVHSMPVWCPEARRKHQIPWPGVTDGYELPCGNWESNPGLLEEEQGFLTTE